MCVCVCVFVCVFECECVCVCRLVSMCLFGCLPVWLSVSVSVKKFFAIKISDVRRGGGRGVSEAFGQPRTDGGGGSENHDFDRTSFVNAP